jgi:hypothetical protein
MRPIFDFSAENAKIVDWLAEKGGFEPPRPFRIQEEEEFKRRSMFASGERHLRG